jgi:hypothetical protein
MSCKLANSSAFEEKFSVDEEWILQLALPEDSAVITQPL